MFLSAGLLLFLSCGSDDTKDVSGEDGDVNSNQYLQVQPNGLNVIKVSSSDVTQVVYPFSVELKGGSASTAFIAELDEWKEEDLKAYNKEEETAYKLLPSSLYSISTSQLAFEQGVTSKEIEVKFDPAKIFAEFKKNGAEYVIALRLTSTTVKVRKSQSDFLLHISFDYPIVSLATTSEEVSISKVLMPISVNTTFNYKVDGEIKNNPWNFSCKLDNVNPVQVAFAITDDQIAVIQYRGRQQTVQQIALRPKRHAAIGGQCQHAVVLINQVDTVTVDDEIIHRAQFAFPHDLTAAQIQRRQVTIISQRVNNAIDDNRRGINVAQTIDFRWACRLRDTLLPNHLALLHQHGAYATVITANNSCAKGGCRSGFATQRQRRHVEVNGPFDGAVGFV